MFDDKDLIQKFGSWIQVQVAFYDFIFIKGTKLCTSCFKAELFADFRDGADVYERAIKAIEQEYSSFEAAWEDFKNEQT